MTHWRTNLMLVAAIAVAAPGCAQDAGIRRTAGLDAPTADIAKIATDANAEVELAAAREVARAAMPDDPRASMSLNDATTRTEPVADLPVTEPGGEAQDGQPPKLTLAYLSRLGMESHPLLRRDAARINSAAGQSLQAGLYPNPAFDTNNPQIFNGTQGTALNVGFTQELVVKGKLRLDRAAAMRAQQQSQFALVQDRYSLLAQIRNQFYQTLAAQYRVDVLNRLLKLTDASVKISQERAKGGTGDQTEVLLLTIDYDRTRADLENAMRMLDGERKQLAAIVGYPGLVQEQVVGSLEATPPSFDEEYMQQFVTSENALVQISKLDIDKNQILLKRAEVEPYPNITIGPAYQYGFNKTQEQFWMTVTFPIPTSNRNQGNIQSARADIKDSVDTLGTVQLELLRKVADLSSTHRGALEQAEQYKSRIIPDARESLRLARSGFEAGVFEFSVYLQAQRTLMDVAKDYVDILERVWTSAADLSGLLQMDQFP